MKRLLLLLVVLAGAVAAAAFTVPSNAANVNGQTISQSALNSDLAAIAASPEYQCALNAEIVVQSRGQAGLPPVNGVGAGTYDSSFVTYWLSRMIDDTLLQQLAARRGVVLTQSQLSSARTEALQSLQTTLNEVSGTQYQCQVTPSAVLASVPSSFSSELITSQAYNDLLVARSAAGDTTDASLRRYFSAHASDFDTLCVSGILVQSQSQASQLRSQIEAGASFSQIASADSQDIDQRGQGGKPRVLLRHLELVCVGNAGRGLALDRRRHRADRLLGRWLRPDPAQRARPGPVRERPVGSARRRAGQQPATCRPAAERHRRQGPGRRQPHVRQLARRDRRAGVLPPPSPPTSSVLSPQANQPTYAAASGGTSGTSG